MEYEEMIETYYNGLSQEQRDELDAYIMNQGVNDLKSLVKAFKHAVDYLSDK